MLEYIKVVVQIDPHLCYTVPLYKLRRLDGGDVQLSGNEFGTPSALMMP
jgi:hypothetical protein